MRTIGIIGGMSWESSAQYYTIINRAVRERLGAPHSAKILMHSLDFGEVERLQHAREWEALGRMIGESARSLQAGGADLLIIATNTMHKLAPEVEAACDLPLLHIADPTAEAIKLQGFTKVGLLGTAFTMERDFYRGRLEDRHGLEVLIPRHADRVEVHRIIYEELVNGSAREESREIYRAVIARLVDRGAEAVILGCTEIMLLVGQEDSEIPLFDTTGLHALAAVDAALV
ncbi:MAG: aspartate/glutamate racemase [Altererythrobacter sp. XM-24bin4]|jgi:aspartate racemase|uniref:Aspartate/glutamate racemase family protein n=1 Tax=Altererythrobacter rubellus TaxID=2173831 RepID=A0A9Y2B7A3_9SPHN|nr:aspartate/glutamate racemase family protein [Altererythrobacter rubellus]PWL26670.1 MAG: aspartate/glutamate racemase [Altererythrobacter sp. XM-24bin4]WIW95370.1 aspartate/glutamate racemase family protein [Altererythrobacter rubellus]